MSPETRPDRSRRSIFSPRLRNLVIGSALLLFFIVIFTHRVAGQEDSGWRISPQNINVQAGTDRVLQVLDDSAHELDGADWAVDNSTLADIREEGSRAVLHPKAAGTVRVSATLHGERRYREIKIWPADQPLPPGTTAWGNHPIGREIGDIAAVPGFGDANMFSLEQTPGGSTYLRAVDENGIQVWSWLLPEKTRNVDLVCGDWLGGALISANRGDSYTLYTVGNDGALRWKRTLSGVRKAHAYNLQHLVHVLSQSPDGNLATLTALDEVTGEQKFELPIPESHQRFTNLRQAAGKFSCGSSSVASLPISTSTLFVNVDGFAYLAFAQNEWTLAVPACTPGSPVEPEKVSFSRDEKAVLWQIHPDGTLRSTVVEQTKGIHPLSEPAMVASPTGALIPDGLGGVLLSLRKSQAGLVFGMPRPADEFVYRLDPEGTVLYRFLLPRYKGRRHDGMVLGENNRGFATRGGTLVQFDVETGRETWRWDSPSEIEVFAALADGSCLVQTPTAVVDVFGPGAARQAFEGKAVMDWRGNIYRKHN